MRFTWKMVKLWKRWRKEAKQDWPFRYIGPDIPPLKGMPSLKYGTPLRREKGQKAAPTGQRYYGPDMVLRVLSKKQVEER